MLKTVLAGATVLALAGGSLVYAHQRGDGGPRAHHWQMSEQDRSAFADARIAALKAGLKLTPDQEKNWPAVESALRDLAKQREDRFAARASADKPKDPIDRLGMRAQAMESRGAALKKLADASEPLYQSLDPAQKHRFMILARLSDSFGRHGHHHGWRGREGFRHRGFQGGPMGPEQGPGAQ